MGVLGLFEGAASSQIMHQPHIGLVKACIPPPVSLEFPLFFTCGTSFCSYITPCLTTHISDRWKALTQKESL